MAHQKVSLPADPYADDRIAWIRSKVESGLLIEFEDAKKPAKTIAGSVRPNLPPPSIADLFRDCLERDDRANLDAVANFLEDTRHDAALVFWSETVSLRVELPPEVASSISSEDIGTATRSSKRSLHDEPSDAASMPSAAVPSSDGPADAAGQAVQPQESDAAQAADAVPAVGSQPSVAIGVGDPSVSTSSRMLSVCLACMLCPALLCPALLLASCCQPLTRNLTVTRRLSRRDRGWPADTATSLTR
ncbi:hypothetical protein BC831DRAFT_55725 [Entophlyctis helioformis]|nr:hypothetical protein BC831DRAFT_55725 [Entophlyctis helioformis]